MFDQSHKDAVKEWYRARRYFWISKHLPTIIGPIYRALLSVKRKGFAGKVRDFFVFKFHDLRDTDPDMTFADWHGPFPARSYHRPHWKKGEATWYQMYETVSEGTPVTPPFPTKNDLINHLVYHGTFWDDKPWSLEAARRFVKNEWAPSMVITGGKTLDSREMYEEGVIGGKS
jgi:hypothetical protein